MQYTENLGLPVVEGTDTMPALRSQGNGIANQLELVLGGLLDDITAIPEIRNDINDINLEIDALTGRVEVLESFETKEKVTINGETVELTKHTAKVETTLTGQSSVVAFKGTEDSDDQRHLLQHSRATARVDLTELFDVRSAESILLRNVTTYQNGYQYMSTKNAMPLNPVCVGQIPNDSHIYLILAGDTSQCYQQTEQTVGGVTTWMPSTPLPFSNDQTVIVTMEWFELA